MITLVGLWEKDWLEPKLEWAIWRQLKHAFQIDRLVMVPKLLPRVQSIDQYDTMEEALQSCEGDLIFLEPSGDHSLSFFSHPEKAVYVFGNAMMDNKRFQGLNLRIPTPQDTDLFAVSAASIILMDRLK